MMEKDTGNRIRSLLDRYYCGETTPAEAGTLRELLERERDLPADLEAELTLLRFLSGEALEPTDAEAARADEIVRKVKAESRRAGRSIFRRYAALSAAAAAAVVILVMAGIFHVDDKRSGDMIAMTAPVAPEKTEMDAPQREMTYEGVKKTKMLYTDKPVKYVGRQNKAVRSRKKRMSDKELAKEGIKAAQQALDEIMLNMKDTQSIMNDVETVNLEFKLS